MSSASPSFAGLLLVVMVTFFACPDLFSQRTVMLTHASEQTCALLSFKNSLGTIEAASKLTREEKTT